MIEKIEVIARIANWGSNIEILIKDKNKQSNYVAQPIIFKKQIPNQISAATIKLSMEEAQQLMDELSLCGIRPSENKGDAILLSEVRDKMRDMGMLVVLK